MEPDTQTRVLVVVGSRHGATRELAQALTSGLASRGVEARCSDAEDAPPPAGYDAVVLGGAIYMGRWVKSLRRYAETHEADLMELPTWLFSSGPLEDGGELKPAEEPVEPARLRERLHARDHRVFAGRLDRDALSVKERMVVAALHAPQVDSRDWAAVDAYAGEIAAALLPSATPV